VTCPTCKTAFDPTRPTQKTCEPCAVKRLHSVRLDGPFARGVLTCWECGGAVPLCEARGPKDAPFEFLASVVEDYERIGDCPRCISAERRVKVRATRDRWEPAPNQRPAVTVPGERRAA